MEMTDAQLKAFAWVGIFYTVDTVFNLVNKILRIK
jgi:hypothetical protein